MKGKYCLTNLVLLGSIIGCLSIGPVDFVDCKDLLPDEILDFALVSENPILPVFSPHLNTHPGLFHSLKTLYFQRDNLLSTILRC